MFTLLSATTFLAGSEAHAQSIIIDVPGSADIPVAAPKPALPAGGPAAQAEEMWTAFAPLRVEDRLAKVAGEGRSEFGHLTVILGSACQIIGNRHAIGVVQFVRITAALRLQGIDQSAADKGKAAGRGKSDGLARQAHDAGWLPAQFDRAFRIGKRWIG